MSTFYESLYISISAFSGVKTYHCFQIWTRRAWGNSSSAQRLISKHVLTRVGCHWPSRAKTHKGINVYGISPHFDQWFCLMASKISSLFGTYATRPQPQREGGRDFPCTFDTFPSERKPQYCMIDSSRISTACY